MQKENIFVVLPESQKESEIHSNESNLQETNDLNLEISKSILERKEGFIEDAQKERPLEEVKSHIEDKFFSNEPLIRFSQQNPQSQENFSSNIPQRDLKHMDSSQKQQSVLVNNADQIDEISEKQVESSQTTPNQQLSDPQLDKIDDNLKNHNPKSQQDHIDFPVKPTEAKFSSIISQDQADSHHPSSKKIHTSFHPDLRVQEKREQKKLNSIKQKQIISQKRNENTKQQQKLDQEIKRLELLLELTNQSQNTEKSQNLKNKQDYSKKELKLNQLISQIEQTLESWKAEQDESNDQFIQKYQIKLQQALKLKAYYSSLNQLKHKSKWEIQFQDYLTFFKIDRKPINDILDELNKKKKSNIKKIELKEKQKLESEIKKFQEYNQKIILFKKLIFKMKPQIQQKQVNQLSEPSLVSKQKQSSIPKFLILFEEGKQKFRVKLNDSQTIRQILISPQINFDKKKISFYYRNQSTSQRLKVDINKKISNFLDYPIQKDCEIQIVEHIEVKLDSNETKEFEKGTSLFEIQKRIGIRSRDFYFFSNHQVYTQQTALADLELRQCEISNVRFLGKLLRSSPIPRKVSFKEMVNYIEFNKFNLEKIETLYVSKVKVEGVEHSVKQKDTLASFISSLDNQERVEEVILQYEIELKIEIIADYPRETKLIGSSRNKIYQLKQKLQRTVKIDKKLQKWMYGDMELSNEKSFQQLALIQCKAKIKVLEIKNLQYYGFETEQKITSHIYSSFYIENDEEFQKQIEESNFPEKQFEFAFRIKALAKIFTCIKKHCRIKTGIDSIKSIVLKSNKKCRLWMPSSAEMETFFNETYVLFNIINSCDDQTVTEICRTYKNHSVLPLKTQTLKGKFKDLREVHYWISTKSINIVSLQISSPVKGKSTFLNEMFKTDFQTQLRHPLCSNKVFIKYDIYTNARYLVDLIDVSTDSLKEDQKIELCQHANILMIHLKESELQITKEWLEKHCKNIPVIFLYRDSQVMENQEAFRSEMMENNKIDSYQKHFHIIQMSAKTVSHYYEYKFCEVSDCINKFVIQIEQSEPQERKWLLNKYFEKASPRLKSYTQKLQNLERQFSCLVDLDLLERKNYDQAPAKISQTFFQLVDLQVFDDTTNFMGKMKEYARIQRTKNLSDILKILQAIKIIIQVKTDFADIEFQKRSIKDHFQKLQKLDNSIKSLKFMKSLNQYKNCEKTLNYQTLQRIYKSLENQFEQVIEKKQFSIENFWRILLFIYSAPKSAQKNFEFKVIYDRIADRALKIFAMQFQKGKTIELINGDTLQIPINLLKSHQEIFLGKKTMVVAVVGGQSSGKSNLLNFLFGCDFLSGQGRCTSGVYLSYYKVEGQNIPGCDGILVLDTEGLFGNHERKNEDAKNFDNKLVLLLLKVCDILIVNCRGDVSKQIQDILELSFENQLMKDEPGRKYPHFNIVLNMKTDKMSGQNTTQIQKLRNKIVEANQEMQKFISSDKSNELPIAFGSNDSKGVSTFLGTIQSTNKIATKQFYQATRNMSLNLIKIMNKRGRKYKQKTLADVYQDIYGTWSMLVRLQILTIHTNRRIKLFDDEVQKFIANLNSDLQEKSRLFNNSIPEKISLIDQWMLKYEESFHTEKIKILAKFQNQFMKRSLETSSLAKIYKIQIESKLNGFVSNLKLQISEKKYKLAVSESSNRGILDLNKKARLIRSNNLNPEEKLQQFDKFWDKYTEDLQKTIDLKRSSKDIFHKVQHCYNNHLKQTSKIQLDQCEYQQIKCHEFNEYALLKLKEFNQKLPQIKPLEAQQIQPVISISKDDTTDLKYNYFDMKTFFEPVPTRFEYYLNYYNLGELIDFTAINKRVETVIRSKQIVVNFISYLKKDLKFLQTTIINEQVFINYLIFALNQLRTNSKSPLYIGQNTFSIYSCPKLKEKIDKIKIMQKNRSSTPNKNHNSKKSATNQLKVQRNDNEYKIFQLISNKQLIQIYESQKSWYKYLQEWVCKDFLKAIIIYMINKYAENNLELYIETELQLKKQLIDQVILDLNKIGVYPYYQLAKNYYYLAVKHYEFKPIQIQNYRELREKVNNMSSYVSTSKLGNWISSRKSITKYQKTDCIAYSNEMKIQIKEPFKNNPILSMYKDREYSSLNEHVKKRELLSLAKKQINFSRILILITKVIQQMPENTDIKFINQQISIVIKEQLEQFNKDLRQISHSLSIDFKYLLHDITKKLIWKKLELEKMKEIKLREQKLKIDKQNQKNIFFGILETDSKPSCSSNAKICIKSYKDFIEPKILFQKQQFIKQKEQQFQKMYTRKFLQQYVDIEIMNCKDPDVLYKYLCNPAEEITIHYDFFLNKFTDEMNTAFKCNTKSCLNQFELMLNKINENIAGAQLNWEVDLIFQDAFVQAKEKTELGVHMRNIFLELLINGETIDSNYKDNKFKIKESIKIQIFNCLSNYINDHFLNKFPEFQIFNFAYFISFAQQEFQKLKIDLEKISLITQQDKQEFKERNKIKLCQSACPCCDRLCDIDMKIDPYHTIHRIDSGHQMRAVKGMIIQKENKQHVKQNFASVIRCQDVGPKTVFSYYGKDYLWEQFVQQKIKQWNFKSKQTNKLLFQHIWNICGHKICDQFTKKGKQMKYLPYSQGTIEYINELPPNYEYIFAIDGSSSMSGQMWRDQLRSLGDILRQISKQQQSTVSILVFDTQCYPFCINKNPSQIDVNQICRSKSRDQNLFYMKFPFVPIDPNPTFLKAAQIIRNLLKKDARSCYFFYIANGRAQHPTTGIRQLLKCKQELKSRQLEFKYTSILIGNDFRGKESMDKINTQMGGRSQFHPNEQVNYEKFIEIFANQ